MQQLKVLKKRSFFNWLPCSSVGAEYLPATLKRATLQYDAVRHGYAFPHRSVGTSWWVHRKPEYAFPRGSLGTSECALMPLPYAGLRGCLGTNGGWHFGWLPCSSVGAGYFPCGSEETGVER